MKIKTTIMVAASGLFLMGCGGTPVGDNPTGDTSDAFPHGFALQSLSPDQGSGAASGRLGAAAPSSTTARIDQILDGNTSLSSTFTPELLFRLSRDAVCYGPTMKYENNPDGAISNDGELPGGDLGIWTISEGNTTEACTTAELNARMDGVKSRTQSGLFLLASSLRAMYGSGASLPAVGSTQDITSSMPSVPNVTFTRVTVEHLLTHRYKYTIALTYAGGAVSRNVTFEIIHDGSGSTTYKGLMSYQVEDSMNGGNCGTGDNNITRKGSLVYERVDSDHFSVDAREADFCGHSLTGGFDSDGLLDPSYKYELSSRPDGWGNNFNRFVANYKVTNQSGQYVYAWQAGPGDQHTRILQMGLNDAERVDGESYFGFGADIASTTATFGENEGMICNWAGAGSSHTTQSYAQREFIRHSTSTSFFEVPTGGDDITYAPTNSCKYDGTGSFQYDRNQDGNLTGSDVVTVKTGASGASELEFDLFQYGSYSTVADMIVARGATLPTAPIWP